MSDKICYFNFFRHFDNALREKTIRPAPKIIYLYLCRCHGEDGRIFPSIKTISDNTGISVTQVYTHLSTLEKLELIERVKGNGVNNNYSIKILPEWGINKTTIVNLNELETHPETRIGTPPETRSGSDCTTPETRIGTPPETRSGSDCTTPETRIGTPPETRSGSDCTTPETRIGTPPETRSGSDLHPSGNPYRYPSGNPEYTPPETRSGLFINEKEKKKETNKGLSDSDIFNISGVSQEKTKEPSFVFLPNGAFKREGQKQGQTTHVGDIVNDVISRSQQAAVGNYVPNPAVAPLLKLVRQGETLDCYLEDKVEIYLRKHGFDSAKALILYANKTANGNYPGFLRRAIDEGWNIPAPASAGPTDAEIRARRELEFAKHREEEEVRKRILEASERDKDDFKLEYMSMPTQDRERLKNGLLESLKTNNSFVYRMILRKKSDDELADYPLFRFEFRKFADGMKDSVDA
jgi:hypothetical protein